MQAKKQGWKPACPKTITAPTRQALRRRQFLNRRLPKGEVLFKVDRLKKTAPTTQAAMQPEHCNGNAGTSYDDSLLTQGLVSRLFGPLAS
jgi:hypothetical protein